MATATVKLNKSQLKELVNTCDPSFKDFINQQLSYKENQQWVLLYNGSTKIGLTNRCILTRVNKEHLDTGMTLSKSVKGVQFLLNGGFTSRSSSMHNPVYVDSHHIDLDAYKVYTYYNNRDLALYSTLVNMFEYERIKRGIEPGEIIIAPWHPPGIAVNIPMHKRPKRNCKYNHEDDTYSYRGKVIYREGQWADVLKPKSV